MKVLIIVREVGTIVPGLSCVITELEDDRDFENVNSKLRVFNANNPGITIRVVPLS